jgi:hypothetical protein
MPKMSRSMPIKMRGEGWDDPWMWRLAIPTSLILHLLIAALLIFGLPEALPQPQEGEPISVELVPPPEPSRNEPYPILQRVFQFGEKDAGPQVSPDGNSANDTSGSPTPPRDLDKRDHPQPPAVTTVRATDEIPQLRTHETSALVPEDAAKAQRAPKLRQAKTLFSQRATGNSIATIAMGYVPRDVGVARLCASELTEQLRHASPSYLAEIVPFDRLKEGTVVENFSATFRSNWEWYNLSYRCEVDTEATKVVSFALDIGNPLTSEEWRRRGCPPNKC